MCGIRTRTGWCVPTSARVHRSARCSAALMCVRVCVYIQAHCSAYRALKQLPGGKEACVGMVHQHIAFYPRHNLPWVRCVGRTHIHTHTHTHTHTNTHAHTHVLQHTCVHNSCVHTYMHVLYIGVWNTTLCVLNTTCRLWDICIESNAVCRCPMRAQVVFPVPPSSGWC